MSKTRYFLEKITASDVRHMYSWIGSQEYAHAKLIAEKTVRAMYDNSETTARRIQFCFGYFCKIHF